MNRAYLIGEEDSWVLRLHQRLHTHHNHRIFLRRTVGRKLAAIEVVIRALDGEQPVVVIEVAVVDI